MSFKLYTGKGNTGGEVGVKTENQKRNEFQSKNRKRINVQKHVRLAYATSGHEQEVHVKKAEKLMDRYKM